MYFFIYIYYLFLFVDFEFESNFISYPINFLLKFAHYIYRTERLILSRILKIFFSILVKAIIINNKYEFPIKPASHPLTWVTIGLLNNLDN